jgi:hypothetical protein
MKNKLNKTALLAVMLFSMTRLFADSPITSTEFYKSYSEFTIVQKAHKSGVMSDTFANYLLNDSNAIDVKAAVINALAWNFNGKQNAPLLMQYILKKYKISNGFDLNILSADDMFCLGYLTIMDNYFETEKPLKILTLARDKNPKSYTINIVLALAEAQKAMDTDWCRVYKVCAEVNKNKNLTKDIKQSAIDIIFGYINDYKESCKDK